MDTNNLLDVYQNVTSNGIVDFNDSLEHNVVFKVNDAYDNKAKLVFRVLSESDEETIQEGLSRENPGNYFDMAKVNKLSDGNISLSFPAHAFYRSFYFNLTIDSSERSFSPVYKVHNRFTPVHKAFNIQIKPDSVADGLEDKMYLAYSNGNGKGRYGFLSAKWEDGHLTAKSRSFGDYTIMVDTVSPEISPVNIGKGKDISGQRTIQVKIWDQETGIRKYRGTINGHWILMEYDRKKQLLTYKYDKQIAKGENGF